MRWLLWETILLISQLYNWDHYVYASDIDDAGKL